MATADFGLFAAMAAVQPEAAPVVPELEELYDDSAPMVQPSGSAGEALTAVATAGVGCGTDSFFCMDNASSNTDADAAAQANDVCAPDYSDTNGTSSLGDGDSTSDPQPRAAKRALSKPPALRESSDTDHSSARAVKPVRRRRKSWESNQDVYGLHSGFELGWRPPLRKERGSRSLGDVATVEPPMPRLAPSRPAVSRPAEPGVVESAPPVPEEVPPVVAVEDEEARLAVASLKMDELLEEQRDEDRTAMLRILQELFAARYLSFSRPFLSATEAEAYGLPFTLIGVRDKLLSNELRDVGVFAKEVRKVFAYCYMTQGHPSQSAISKKCERIDAVFEQNVSLLPRALRSRASIVVASPFDDPSANPNGAAAPAASDGTADERRRSARARVEVVMPTTLQLVDQERQRQRLAMDQQRRLERERLRAAAEEWALEKVDTARLSQVRQCEDLVWAAQFLSAFSEVLGAGPFSLPEFEMAITAFPCESVYLRRAIPSLLRAAGLSAPKPPPGAAAPSARAVAATVADALRKWGRNLALAANLEESGQDVPETLEPFLEGGEMHERLIRLGDPYDISALLISQDGFGALALPTRAGVLHALCEAALLHDRSLANRAYGEDGSPPSAARAHCLGCDSTGVWYHHFPDLEARVYAFAAPLRFGPATPPAVVAVGEMIQVEVEEEGQVEWRRAVVSRLLRGGSGRFAATVLLDDGTPDDDFVEIFNPAQQDKDWRKLPRKGRAPKASKLPKSTTGGKGRKRRFDPIAEAIEPSAAIVARGLWLVELQPVLKSLKSSKKPKDTEIREELQRTVRSQEEASAQVMRTWSAAAMRLMREVLEAQAERETGIAEPPPDTNQMEVDNDGDAEAVETEALVADSRTTEAPAAVFDEPASSTTGGALAHSFASQANLPRNTCSNSTSLPLRRTRHSLSLGMSDSSVAVEGSGAQDQSSNGNGNTRAWIGNGGGQDDHSAEHE